MQVARVQICPHTCLAQRILSRRAFCLRRAVLASVVLSACFAGVVFGIERAAGAGFAFCRICTVLRNQFLARSALCDWHQERSPFALATHL